MWWLLVFPCETLDTFSVSAYWRLMRRHPDAASRLRFTHVHVWESLLISGHKQWRGLHRNLCWLPPDESNWDPAVLLSGLFIYSLLVLWKEKRIKDKIKETAVIIGKHAWNC